MTDEQKKEVDEKTSEENVETPPTYRDKIQGFLDKVDLGEEVFGPPPVDEVGKIISDCGGVQDGIRNIFGSKEKTIVTESVEEEVEDVKKAEVEQDSPKEVSPSSFVLVDEQKDAPDIFPVWEKALSFLNRLGTRIDDGPTFTSRRIDIGDETDIVTIRLAKNIEKNSVPYMQVSFGTEEDATPAELAIPYIESVGVSVNHDTVYETPEGNKVYFEFDA